MIWAALALLFFALLALRRAEQIRRAQAFLDLVTALSRSGVLAGHNFGPIRAFAEKLGRDAGLMEDE